MKRKKLLAAILAMATALTTVPGEVVNAAEIIYDEDIEWAQGIEEAAQQFKEGLLNRSSSIQIYVELPEKDDDIESKIKKLALGHTGNGKEGAYLEKAIYTGSPHMIYPEELDGKFRCQIVCSPTYRMTAAQEEALEAKVSEILNSLKLDGKSDYEKVKAIYDYVTSHATYDYEGLEKFDDGNGDKSYVKIYTPYGTLVEGKSVCEGFALSMYRLLNEEGVDCRYVGGQLNGDGGWGAHVWNLVRIDGKYYYLDATTAEGTKYTYFLKSEAGLKGDYEPQLSEQILQECDISTTDYVMPEQEPTKEPTKTPTKEPTKEPTQGPTKAPTKAPTATTAPTLTVTTEPTKAPTVSPSTNPTTVPEENPNAEKASDFEYIITEDGEVTITKYLRDKQDVIFPSYIEGKPVTRIAKEAVIVKKKMVSLEIPEGVRTLEPQAIYNCMSLKTLYLPTTLEIEMPEKFEDYQTPFSAVAFFQKAVVAEGSPYLKTDELGNLYTADGKMLILGNKTMTEYEVPSGVEFIGDEAFRGNYNIKSVILPEGLRGIGAQAFWGNREIRELVLPSTLEYIGVQAFDSLKVRSLHLPKTLNYAESFGRIDNLKEITIEEGNECFYVTEDGLLCSTEKARSEKNAAVMYLNACGNTVCIVPDGIKKITYKCFDGMFQTDKQIVIPASVEEIVANGFYYTYAFEGRKQEVYFLGNPPKLESNTFFESKVTAYYPKNNDLWSNYLEQNAESALVKDNVWIAFENEPVEKEGYFTWQEENHSCEYTYYIKVGDSEIATSVPCVVKYVPDVNSSIAGNDNYIATATVNGKTVTDEKKIIATHVSHDVIHFNEKEATCSKEGNEEYYACTECGKRSLEENLYQEASASQITIPKNSNHNVKYLPAKPADCESTGMVAHYICTDCGKHFQDKEAKVELDVNKLTVKIGEHTWDSGKVTRKPNAVTSGICLYTCMKCKCTKSVSIPTLGVPKKGTILVSGKNSYRVTKAGAKNGTVELYKLDSKTTKLKIPETIRVDGITYKVTGIADNAAKNHKKLTSVVLTDNIERIGVGSFRGCKKLKTVTTGKGLKIIGKQAFYQCRSLSKLNITSARLTSVGSKALKGIKSNAKIYVPKSKYTEYKRMFKNKGQGNNVTIKSK